MSASNFNLRNVAPDVMTKLKREAAKQKISVNSFILQIIEYGLGISQKTKKIVYHDLDHLSGTWTERDKNEFDESVKSFGTIDKEMWQ